IFIRTEFRTVEALFRPTRSSPLKLLKGIEICAPPKIPITIGIPKIRISFENPFDRRAVRELGVRLEPGDGRHRERWQTEDQTAPLYPATIGVRRTDSTPTDAPKAHPRPRHR